MLTIDELRRDSRYHEAVCLRRGLCEYIRETRTDQWLVERCKKCHRRIFFKIINGHMDRRRMSLAHTRDFLTNGSQLYAEEYGYKPMEAVRKPYDREETLREAKDYSRECNRIRI